MPKLSVNGTEVEVVPGTSVLQACEQLGIEIPRFCYHDRLSVPANCRMCLVEIEKTPKPVASCALPCADGMIVKTESEMVKKARKGVMEMLLINHPLDCPICDQGGECDLQDQAVAYGFDRGRYTESKRAVKDKNIGPLVKTVMTRCIQCTRCIRFIDEVAGTPVLGGINRGEHMEIDTYVSAAVTSELSGNLVDVCPVGALTNKPYAFSARPWELQKTESIDVMDGIGSSIRIDTRGNEIMRVLPRLNEDVNEEWINDKSRYACDGLKRQRLDKPYVRINGKLQAVTWPEALGTVAEKLMHTDGGKIAAIAGDLADCESMFALRMLMNAMNAPSMDCRQDGAVYDTSQRVGYLFNSTIAGIEQADVVLLVGVNPRYEGTMVNSRIRKRWMRGGLRVGVIGQQVDLTYPYRHLGDTTAAIHDLATGKSDFAQTLRTAKKPMLIVGAGALARADGAAIQAALRQLTETYPFVQPDWNGFNVLHTAASRVGGLTLDFLPQKGGQATTGIIEAAGKGDIKVVYLLGADEIDMAQLGKAFVIYQGHHGDKGAHRADVILPGAAYTEKNSIYVNTEGRPQGARQAAFPPGEAKEDWKIIRALSEKIGKILPFDSLAQLRQRMTADHPLLAKVGDVTPAEWKPFGKAGAFAPQSFGWGITQAQFYQTNAICRASETMAECVDMAQGRYHLEAAE